jgi:nucleotide-binding universal stress UspA family protein
VTKGFTRSAPEDTTKGMETVLACVDFTHDPDGVARVGGALAHRLGVPLVLATILPPPVDPWVPAGAAAAPLTAAPMAIHRAGDPGVLGSLRDDEVLDSIRDDEERRLSHLAAEQDLDAFRACVRFSVDTADALRRIAVSEDAALLVVGATRHRPLGAAVLGSTSHSLCAHAPCPVVVVPADRHGHGD